MKKQLIFSLLILLIIAISCTKRKSVVQQLKPKEVKTLIEEDSLYEEVITDIEEVREVLNNDLVLQSKFEDLTYQDYYDYKKKITDSSLVENRHEKAQSIYNSQVDSLLKKYKPEIDKKISYYKEQLDKFHPKNFFKVEFASVSKEYYSSMNKVRQVNVKFRIIPLQGPIQGGSFRYEVIPKVTEKSMGSGGCRFSNYTSSPSIYTWEAPYDIEDEFEFKSTSNIKNNYDFEFEILTARANNKTYSKEDIDIPFYYELYIEKDSLDNYQYANLIEEQFNVEVQSFFELLSDIEENQKRKINKTAFELEKLIIENE